MARSRKHRRQTPLQAHSAAKGEFRWRGKAPPPLGPLLRKVSQMFRSSTPRPYAVKTYRGAQPSIFALILAIAWSASRSFCRSTIRSPNLPSTGTGMVYSTTKFSKVPSASGLNVQVQVLRIPPVLLKTRRWLGICSVTSESP